MTYHCNLETFKACHLNCLSLFVLHYVFLPLVSFLSLPVLLLPTASPFALSMCTSWIPPSVSLYYIYNNNNNSRSPSSEKECFVMEKMMMEMKDGWLGKISRNMYAVLCLGIVLFAVAYVYYAFPGTLSFPNLFFLFFVYLKINK